MTHQAIILSDNARIIVGLDGKIYLICDDIDMCDLADATGLLLSCACGYENSVQLRDSSLR